MVSNQSRNNAALAKVNSTDLIGQFRRGLKPAKPWANITEFVTSPEYLGYQAYPKQITLLRLIYLETENMTDYDIEVIEEWRKGFGFKASYGVQADVWERVAWLKERNYRRFPHIENVTGRRGGKGWIGSVLGAESISYLVSLDNWQKHYHIQPGKDLFLSVVATNQAQAMKFQFADISQGVRDCKFLDPYRNQVTEQYISVYSPNDLREIAALQAKGEALPNKDLATIKVQAMAAASASGRGAAGYANYYDEFAHMLNGTGGPADSEKVYSAYQPSLKQFKKDGLTYIPSSPWTKVGQFYKLYQDGSVLMPEYAETHGLNSKALPEDEDKAAAVAKPTMLIYQNTSWSSYEDYDRAEELLGYKIESAVIEYDDEMAIDENRDKAKFKVEFRGQFAEVSDAYLDADKVDAMFAPFWGGRTLSPAPYGQMHYEYHAHMDPSSVNANFAFGIAHLEEAPADKDGHIWPHVIVDYLKVWKPSDFPDHMVDYVSITDEIKDQIFPLYPSLTQFTTDQYNLPGLLSLLRQADHPVRIREENFNKQSNIARAEAFKGALNLQWIHAYRDNYFGDNEGSLLEMELKFLSLENGQAVRQETGPVTTKDAADVLMVIATRLLKQSLDNYMAKRMGGLTPSYTNDQLTRVVDRQSIGQKKTTREELNDMAVRLGGRGLASSPRWNR